ncbi:hypothetical protein [Sphingobacterium multivorum]|uniref:hypothetical protein n=1 Tax=Sphingobacterium multivorum TaxID=28454 RepID=UPI0031BB08F5
MNNDTTNQVMELEINSLTNSLLLNGFLYHKVEDKLICCNNLIIISYLTNDQLIYDLAVDLLFTTLKSSMVRKDEIGKITISKMLAYCLYISFFLDLDLEFDDIIQDFVDSNDDLRDTSLLSFLFSLKRNDLQSISDFDQCIQGQGIISALIKLSILTEQGMTVAPTIIKLFEDHIETSERYAQDNQLLDFATQLFLLDISLNNSKRLVNLRQNVKINLVEIKAKLFPNLDSYNDNERQAFFQMLDEIILKGNTLSCKILLMNIYLNNEK